MSRISRIIFSELKFLFRTVALIGTILMFFIAALLSVISVLIDIPNGFYSGLDNMFPYTTLSVSDIDATAAIERGGTPLYGTVDGITRYSTLTAKKSVSVTPSPMADDKEPIQLQPTLEISFTMITTSGLPLFNEYSSCVTKGKLPEKCGEMALMSDIAKMIDASIGDEVTVSPDQSYVDPDGKLDLSNVAPMTFTVTGLINMSKLNSIKNSDYRSHPIPASYVYAVSDALSFNSLCIDYPSSRKVHSEMKFYLGQGKEIKAHDQNAYEIIDTAVAFFGAVTAVLGLMVVFIIYSLIAIFYRQRKGMICRLKLFGASDRQIALIYCTITVSLVLIGVIVGSVLALAFNSYFINLCGSLFDTISANFESHFRPIVQFTVFMILALITMGLFFVFDRKIKRAPIAAEVRYE